ncbi:MAG: response regulator, partial [Desulfobacterales bacterium]|nr:response regulator [Desulfobacterales bacterium]
MSAKILIVDDESNLLRLVGYALQVEGYEIATTQSGMEALNKIQTEKPDSAIHPADAPMLTRGGRALWFGMSASSPAADMMLEGSDEITLGHLNLKVLHTPGHSP